MSPIILIGMKSSGKSSSGRALAQRLGVPFIDLDDEIEARYAADTAVVRTCREIYREHGAAFFRQLEYETLLALPAKLANQQYVLATGGGAPLDPRNHAPLKALGTVVFLDAALEVLLPRIVRHGIPPFFAHPDDPYRSLQMLMVERRPFYQAAADVVIEPGQATPLEMAAQIEERLMKGA